MTLLSSPHWLMESDASTRVVWLRRSPVPFGSLVELTGANEAVVGKFVQQYESWSVVVDMRLAPPRNDPAFEAAMRGLRSAIEARFARTAVLLATQVGMLQVNRLTRQDGATSFATTDEVAALRFARGED
jgi:hypothetical protein